METTYTLFFKDLNDLAKEIHAGNVERGFYDKPRKIGNSIFQIICELAEAVEADRNPDIKRNVEAEAKVAQDLMLSGDTEAFVAYYKEHIRGSIAEELADACIRILDFAAANNLEVQLDYNYMHRRNHTGDFDFAEEMMVVVSELEMLYNRCRLELAQFFKEQRIHSSLSYICWIAEEVGANMPLHIDLKVAYNSSRPRLHGKKY
jgi:hypothetical protein